MTVDKRVRDDRVKAARRADWEHPSEWDLSNLDRMDGIVPVVTDSILTPVPARPQVDFERVTEPVRDNPIARVLVTVWGAVIIGAALVAFGWMVGSGFLMEMVTR